MQKMQDNPNNVQALTIRPAAAAQLAGVSARTITRMCEAGELPAVKLRSSWLINRAEFMRTIGVQA